MFLKISFLIALAFSDLIGYNRLRNNVNFFQNSRNSKIEWHSPNSSDETMKTVLKILRKDSQKKHATRPSYKRRRFMSYMNHMKLIIQ